MAWNTGDDYNKSGLIGDYTLIDGLYYYVVDKYCDDIDLSYIGFVDTIQNITFNPFLDSMDFNGVTAEFNTERYGQPKEGIPKVYRIKSQHNLEKTIKDFYFTPHTDSDYTSSVPWLSPPPSRADSRQCCSSVQEPSSPPPQPPYSVLYQ